MMDYASDAGLSKYLTSSRRIASFKHVQRGSRLYLMEAVSCALIINNFRDSLSAKDHHVQLFKKSHKMVSAKIATTTKLPPGVRLIVKFLLVALEQKFC